MKRVVLVMLVLAASMAAQEVLAQVRVNIGIGVGGPWRYGGYHHRSRVVVRSAPVIIAEPPCEDEIIVAPRPVVVVPAPRVVYVEPRHYYYGRRHYRYRRW